MSPTLTTVNTLLTLKTNNMRMPVTNDRGSSITFHITHLIKITQNVQFRQSERQRKELSRTQGGIQQKVFPASASGRCIFYTKLPS